MNYTYFVGQLLFSVLLGGLTGWQRERAGKSAGIRTHALVSFASTVFTILSVQAFPEGDSARIAAQILVGIGFIGAGTILHNSERIEGLTTAAGLWAVTAIGMTIGVGWFIPALIATAVLFLILLIDDHKFV